ncbi:hypothetical protein OAE49_06305 [Gammaproteobacteria bacterium]|nr:hypothetical protein [Gammaproteobacteria bacterium]
MADAVATQTLLDGEKMVVQKFTNISDGNGESAVVKVDVSALTTNARGQACTGVTIEKIWWQCIGMKVQIFWNATTNVFCIELGENQSGNHDYTAFGGLPNNAGTGKNGDVLFTTVGHTSADTYTIIMSMRKEYG